MFARYLIAAIFTLSLVGCASVPMGDAKRNAELKTFKTNAAVAGIYIYRNESFGAAVKMDILVDGKALGETAAKTYFYSELTPGKHTITSKSENDDTIEIDTVAGKLYYVWQEVKMGLMYARTKLHLVSEEEGKKGVLESELIATK